MQYKRSYSEAELMQMVNQDQPATRRPTAYFTTAADVLQRFFKILNSPLGQTALNVFELPQSKDVALEATIYHSCDYIKVRRVPGFPRILLVASIAGPDTPSDKFEVKVVESGVTVANS